MLTLNDVSSILIKFNCQQSTLSSCEHSAMVKLKSGRHAEHVHHDDLCCLVHNLALETINPGPGASWNAEQVKEHFIYKEDLHSQQAAQEVLNKIFETKDQTQSCILL